MTVNPAVGAWETMRIETIGSSAVARRISALRGATIVVLRTVAAVLLAGLAILVLLPAALSAQAAIAV